jgi:hypothetical protein
MNLLCFSVFLRLSPPTHTKGAQGPQITCGGFKFISLNVCELGIGGVIIVAGSGNRTRVLQLKNGCSVGSGKSKKPGSGSGIRDLQNGRAGFIGTCPGKSRLKIVGIPTGIRDFLKFALK